MIALARVIHDMTLAEIKKHFARKLEALQEEQRKLQERQQAGFGYRVIRRRGYRVSAHHVRSHWAVIPVSNKKRKTVER